MEPKVTIPSVQRMKRDRRKIVGVVVWDCQIAQIVDRAGVEIVSVGDSVGVNLWGHAGSDEVTLDEMLIVCKAVRRGVKRALVSCDIPNKGLEAAVRLKEAGADLVKLSNLSQVRATVRAGIPVFADSCAAAYR